MASPLTVLSELTDGRILSIHADYLTARAGGTISAPDNSANQAACGQYIPSSSYLSELFVEFDTSVIGAGKVITAATLSVAVQLDASTGVWTMEARAAAWTPPLASQWIPGATLAGLPLVASKTFSAAPPLNTYLPFTSQAAFLAAINPTGKTGLVLSHSGLAAGVVNSNYMAIHMRNGGTTLCPKLVVEYEDGAASVVVPVCGSLKRLRVLR